MAKQTRRKFCEYTLLSTTAALTIGPGVARAQEEGSKTDSPNEKLNVAVIGVRGRGGSHIDGFAGKSETDVTVICDCDENVGQKKAADLKKKTGTDVKFVKDLREVMDDKDVDIVSIATPNHWHSLASIWAMQAGKDVYVEKPVSHNVSEGRRMVQASEKYKKICQTGTQCRTQSGTVDAIEYIQSGKLGQVFSARGLCYKPRGSIGKKGNYDVPAGVDYRLWLGPAPDAPLTRPKFHYDWHWQWAYGNGDLGNQGIHQMDIARWGLGVEGLGDSVVSYGGRLGYEDAGETANTQVSVHQFGDKRLTFEVRGLKTGDLRGAKVGVLFYGEEGIVVLTSYTKGAAYDWDGNQLTTFGGGGDHFGNFVKAVKSRDRGDLNADIEEGHLSSALCHLGNISYRHGEQIALGELQDRMDDDRELKSTVGRFAEHVEFNKVDLSQTPLYLGASLKLDGEQFTGSNAEKANQMLSREYHKDFEVPSEANL